MDWKTRRNAKTRRDHLRSMCKLQRGAPISVSAPGLVKRRMKNLFFFAVSLATLELRISLGQWLWLSSLVFRKPGTIFFSFFFFFYYGWEQVGGKSTDFQFLVYIPEGYGEES